MRWIIFVVMALLAGTSLFSCDDQETDGDADSDSDSDSDADADVDADVDDAGSEEDADVDGGEVVCEDLPGQGLLGDRCAACHSLAQVTARDDDRDGWTEIVDRMIGNGADLDATERADLIDFLVCSQ